MWRQTYDPLESLFLSALVAALPILFFLVALIFLQLTGLTAAVATLAISRWTRCDDLRLTLSSTAGRRSMPRPHAAA